MKTLLFIVGPSAVGKMTVGEEISKRTGFPLFHNHLSLEPILRIFPFGSPQFFRLCDIFRVSTIEEAAKSDLPGLIFTVVIAFNVPGDVEAMERYADIYRNVGGRACFLELAADLEVRLERNAGENRLAEKPSKRDLERSREWVVGEAKHQLNSDEAVRERADWLFIDNTNVAPDVVAERTIAHFGLA